MKKETPIVTTSPQYCGHHRNVLVDYLRELGNVDAMTLSLEQLEWRRVDGSELRSTTGSSPIRTCSRTVGSTLNDDRDG